MPSADLLSALPTLDRTRELTRALAVLDAVMSRDWESRYYSFDPAWSDDEQMASMRNGSGDDWFCWFGPPGAAIVGFDHESPMSTYVHDPPALWPGLLSGVPKAFTRPVLEEPAFSVSDTTFLIWRQPGDSAWRAGGVVLPDEPDPDGARHLLELLLDDDPTAYVRFAGEYYERDLPLDGVAAIYRSTPLTSALVESLHSGREFEAVAREAREMGYPVATR